MGFAAVLACAAALSPAQPPPPPPSVPTQPVPQPAPDPANGAPNEQARNVPPQLLLGARVEHIRRLAGVWSTVVIVSDPASYIEAIAAWSPSLRFPVLIDDGSLRAREDIARFVRAFEPARVVRWSKEGSPANAAFAPVSPALLDSALARSWGAPGPHDQASLLAFWRKQKYAPPGIVVAAPDDPAWPAALALAAGRGQPIAYLPVMQNVDHSLTLTEADAFAKAVEEACEATGFQWRALGDDIEAITLCVHAPVRFDTGKGASLALSDRIGRLGTGLEARERWAWCGHIFGRPPQAAYMAMCSLFLQPARAWVFDGYVQNKPWSDFDGTQAAANLRKINLDVTIDDSPRQGARDWRLRASRPVNADLIFINSSGNADFFNLEPGQCYPGDIPILTHPALVHMVHSWSTLFASNRDLISGRWLEHGAFAYCGSVNEPYLTGFVPTPQVVLRLMSGAPFGVSVRYDGSPMWKIAVIGDPLYKLGEKAKRVDDPAPPPPALLASATPVDAALRDLLQAENYVDAINILNTLGRDEGVRRLMEPLLKDKPQAVTSEVAQAVLLPLMRAGSNAAVVSLFAKLDASSAGDPMLRDALWLAAYPLLEAPDEALLGTLRANLRPGQLARDAVMLAGAWARKHDRAAAEAMLRSVRESLTDKAQREAFDGVVKEWK